MTLSSPQPEFSNHSVEKNPQKIWIEPTTRCNARCIHCHHHYSDFGEDMPWEVYQKIRTSLLGDVKEVILTGYGEALVFKGFASLLKDCRERGCQVNIITNGIPLQNDGLRKKLVEAGVDLNLSMDGAKRETFESIRQGVKWDKIIEALEKLRQDVDNFARMHLKTKGLSPLYHKLGCVGGKRPKAGRSRSKKVFTPWNASPMDQPGTSGCQGMENFLFR